MKIRIKLTLFFTFIFILLFIIIYSYLSNSFKTHIFNTSQFRIDRFIEGFIDMNKLKEVKNYEEIKNIKIDIPQRKRKDSNNEERKDFFPFIWLIIYDKDLNIINSTNLAKSYPIKIKYSDLKKKYFRVNFEKINKDDLLLFNDGDISSAIAKSYNLHTKENEIFYIVTLFPFSKENDYIKELELIIIRILVFFIVVFFIIGYFYAKYSLNPINKIQNQLNKISDDDLSKRIVVKNNNDEVGELTNSINNLLNRIENAFLMEKQFVSDVSHEFKTPISILRLSIENLINEDSLSDQILEKLGQSLEILYSMDFLVQKLLYLSKLEQNIIPFKPDIFNLSETISLIVKNLDFIAVNKNIKITTIIDKNIQINGDKELIYIALYNVIENSLKYTEKGIVSVIVTKSDNFTMINVEDSGCGIPEDKIDRIFDRFFRVDEARKINEGYGIGLTIVKRIIDLHKGKINVKSNLGYGTNFEIILDRMGMRF